MVDGLFLFCCVFGLLLDAAGIPGWPIKLGRRMCGPLLSHVRLCLVQTIHIPRHKSGERSAKLPLSPCRFCCSIYWDDVARIVSWRVQFSMATTQGIKT